MMTAKKATYLLAAHYHLIVRVESNEGVVGSPEFKWHWVELDNDKGACVFTSNGSHDKRKIWIDFLKSFVKYVSTRSRDNNRYLEWEKVTSPIEASSIEELKFKLEVLSCGKD